MASNSDPEYRGTDRLVLGIVLAVVTFWLFAQTTLNVAPAMRHDLAIGEGTSNLAVSITALASGIFIVVAGGVADRFGRVKLTNVGLLLSAVGSLSIALSPTGTPTFLIIGRVSKRERSEADPAPRLSIAALTSASDTYDPACPVA